MIDVAYFISRRSNADESRRCEEELLDCYFEELRRNMSNEIAAELEAEWRKLYPVAWAYFVRFLQGWASDHYKLNEYSNKQVKKAKAIVL